MQEKQAEAKSAQAFEKQPGFASRQDAPPLAREIQRRVMLAIPLIRSGLAKGREFLRKLRGAPHTIEVFHQIDDPYSQLALEAINELTLRYDVVFRFHLVSQTDRLHAPEPELLAAYGRRDCGLIAPHYGLAFPTDTKAPAADSVREIEVLLAGLVDDPRFLPVALEAGRALFRGDDLALGRLTGKLPKASSAEVDRALSAGNALRKKRRHYSGGMFWYAGEWYWGVDRLHHLERRLIRYGAGQARLLTPRFDRPPIDPGERENQGQLSLEIFPSLRSPYTAMIFDRSLEMAARVGVPVTLRPVMPMVMRGVPAPAAKGIYIMLDTRREAEHIGAPFGNMFDPIGRPVEQGFALWPFAYERGRGAEFLSSFLRAAFVEGRNTGTPEGLRRVVREAGLDPDEAERYLAAQNEIAPEASAWRAELESNRVIMYEELGVWGVPSYRLSGPAGEEDLCVWGQDRLWLVAAEIKRRLADGPPAKQGARMTSESL